jgi:hypothetical protein
MLGLRYVDISFGQDHLSSSSPLIASLQACWRNVI